MDIAEFHSAVYDTVRLIPIGKVTSYGHIARLIGMPNYSRHVGQALKLSGPDVNSSSTMASCYLFLGLDIISRSRYFRRRTSKVNLRTYGWFPDRLDPIQHVDADG
ncbi:hypothetical protein F5878DRAFT_614911 [Lentinula raphanica]|uniref:Methylated-DNA-[protein]-cysteine S-methyltransferase DNA binding domain-containing protein n=1 Tax=Lentinula raphanica TaxID=153919 RepID=A0AA38PBW8_9AGAR|nr:hypothetical protein F5878DRAFT_614911 [Lentinula raphanica]